MASVEHGGTHALGWGIRGVRRWEVDYIMLDIADPSWFVVNYGHQSSFWAFANHVGHSWVWWCMCHNCSPPKSVPGSFLISWNVFGGYTTRNFARLDLFWWSEISPIPHWDDPNKCPMLSWPPAYTPTIHHVFTITWMKFKSPRLA